ncbi:putative protein kinase RLK-Pelle-LRR-VIII-1 family [Helianthus anomalus]
MLLDIAGENLDHLKFRLNYINLATNKFSETLFIRFGTYGEVYKAKLSVLLEKKNDIVAIKRIYSRKNKQGERDFIVEIELLSKCNHPNIVSLHGFYDEEGEMILVYEFVSNGSLDDYLENVGNMKNFMWAKHIQICLNISHGL